MGKLQLKSTIELYFAIFSSEKNMVNYLMKKTISFFLFLVLIACTKDTPQFTLTINATSGGSVNLSGGTYNENENVIVVATPAEGYQFSGWEGDASGNVNPLTVTMTDDKTIQATFSRTQYALTVNKQGRGTVSQSLIIAGKSSTDYVEGSVVELNAQPDTQWVFYQWSGVASPTVNPIELLVDEPKTITAIFEQTYDDIRNELNSFRGVGKWKIRPRPRISSKSSQDCELLSIIFRSAGSFTAVTSIATVTGQYAIESNNSIQLSIGDMPYGQMTDIVLTDNYIGFSLNFASGCSLEATGDKDPTFDENTETEIPETVRIIANFEDNVPLNYYGFNGVYSVRTSNPYQTGINPSTHVLEIQNRGDLYEGVLLAPGQRIDMRDPNKQIIQIDFYQETAQEVSVMLKLEYPITDEFNQAQYAVEVMTTASQAGWQRLEFDFGNRRVNSFPHENDPLVDLSSYNLLALFIGNNTTLTGTFYIDNIFGGISGAVIQDTDEDGVFDSIDSCPDEAGAVDYGGCPPN